MFEKKYRIVFVRKEYSTLTTVKVVNSNEISEALKISDKTFKVNLSIPAYIHGKTKVYFFNFDDGSQLKFEFIKVNLNPKELNLMVSSKIMRDLVSGAMENAKEKIFNMLIGAVIGGLLTALIMFFYMQNKIDEIYANLSITTII